MSRILAGLLREREQLAWLEAKETLWLRDKALQKQPTTDRSRHRCSDQDNPFEMETDAQSILVPN